MGIQGVIPVTYLKVALAAASFALATGCPGHKPQPVANVHSYNGTAATGDFITMTVDRDAQAIAFNNLATGNSGTLSYTVNADGVLVVTDTSAEIVKAYEIPGFALVAWDQKAKDGTQMSLVFAFEKVTAKVSDFANFSFASIEFRSSDGGTDLSCGTVDSAGVMNGAGYIPLEVVWGSPYTTKTGMDIGANLTADTATGTLTAPGKPGEPPLRLFKTESGAWGVGSGIWFPSSATGTFPGTAAGTYFVLGFRKTGEGDSSSGIYGTPAFFDETLTVSSSGEINDGTNAVQLQPLRQSGTFTGTVLDIDPCNGLFTFTPADGGEGFAFVYGNAIYFSTFHLTDSVTPLYDYSYGVALRK